MSNTGVVSYQCLRCGVSWDRPESMEPLVRCPGCRTHYWDRAKGEGVELSRNQHRCLWCGTRWESMIISPKACPHCYVASWSKPRPLSTRSLKLANGRQNNT